ncbi:MAG: hypothetical protein ACKO0Z_08375 [Betaproteobacteria bacterium]
MHGWAAQAAAELIAENGRVATLVTISNSGSAWNPVQTSAEVDVIVLQTSFSSTDKNQWLIEVHDKAFLMDSSVTPIVGSTLVDGAIHYSIINVATIAPGETTILHKLQVRI